MKDTVGKLPEGAKSEIKEFVSEHLGTMKDKAGKLASIPGVGEILKPVLDRIFNALSSFGAR